MLSKKLFMHNPIYLKGGKVFLPSKKQKTTENLDDYIPKTYYEKPNFKKSYVNEVSKNHSNVPPIMNSENHPEVDSIVDFEKKHKGRPTKKNDDKVYFTVK